jgi:hypothetical protein
MKIIIIVIFAKTLFHLTQMFALTVRKKICEDTVNRYFSFNQQVL